MVPPAPARAAAAALLACALLLGCAGGGGRTGGGPGDAPAAAPAPASGAGPAAMRERGRFNGLYQGRQFPSDTNSASNCRSRAREVWFEVEGGSIEMRNNRHRRNKRKLGMLGTVSAEGSVAMRQADGGRTVVGRIEGDRLTAANVQDGQDLQAVQAGGKPPCAYRFEATRRSGP